MSKKRRKHTATGNKRKMIGDGGRQCETCKVLHCRKMELCAYFEFVAECEERLHECPDREEGDYLKLMDAA